jgi:enterochelin esterase-like enzyme
MSLPVHIYLPPCYDPAGHAYPALYLIRGTDGYGNWIKNGLPELADEQIAAGALPAFIAVMPATDERARGGGKYRYSSSGGGSWEEFMLSELLPFVESNYSVWRDRDGRAIGGISRGAYWSLEIAFRHPDVFSIVAGHSPAITPDILIGVPGNFSMLDLAESADSVRSLRIYLDAGDNDWARRGVQRLSEDLDASGIPYTATSGEGIHSDPYWASRMGDYLAFYAAGWPSAARAKASSVGFAGNAVPGQP